MKCPYCQANDSSVVDSRAVNDGAQIRRRRVCSHCQGRFTTYETIERILPRVIKRDLSREAFNEPKLRDGMLRALEKRPVSMDTIERAIQTIIDQCTQLGEKEVSSEQLGEWVMEQLKELDQIAYIRFASVYRCFQDLDAFKEEIENILRSDRSLKSSAET